MSLFHPDLFAAHCEDVSSALVALRNYLRSNGYPKAKIWSAIHCDSPSTVFVEPGNPVSSKSGSYAEMALSSAILSVADAEAMVKMLATPDEKLAA